MAAVAKRLIAAWHAIANTGTVNCNGLSDGKNSSSSAATDSELMQKTILQAFEDFFEKENRTLEDWVWNDGRVSLILQSPSVSAVVVCWNDELPVVESTSHCKKLCVWVVHGKLEIEYEKNEDESVKETIHASNGMFFSDLRKHSIRGSRGSVSVHVYDTESINHSVTLRKDLVYCNESLSLTDLERGRSFANIFGKNPSDFSTNSIELCIGLRELIELLHHEVEYLPEGCIHSNEHITKIRLLLESIRIDDRELQPYLNFTEQGYTRNLVGYDAAKGSEKAKFTVLVICWDKGKMSRIHDHSGSSCWVKVLKGKLREVRYELTEDGVPKEIQDMTFCEQQACYINDTQGIHAMGNGSSDQVAVSLHVYAPPYILCSLFNLNSTEKSIGSLAVARIPQNPSLLIESNVDDVSTNREIPISLTQFYSLLDDAISNENFSEVGNLLKRLALQDHEWKEFVHFDPWRYTRSLVSLDKKFSLMVCCWNKSQKTPLHSHGQSVRSWAKILSGNMFLKQSLPNDLSETFSFDSGEMIDTTYFENPHVLGNSSDDDVAVTLNLFTPPFVKMGYVDHAGIDRVIPIMHSATSAEKLCSADFISCCNESIERERNRLCSAEFCSSAKIFDTALDEALSCFNEDEGFSVYTNLYAFSRFISLYDMGATNFAMTLVRSLDHVRINRVEWMQRFGNDPSSHFSVLVSQGHNYSIVLQRWVFGEEKRCICKEKQWLKVLEGEVILSQYLDGVQTMCKVLLQENSVFMSGILECKLRVPKSGAQAVVLIVTAW